MKVIDIKPIWSNELINEVARYGYLFLAGEPLTYRGKLKYVPKGLVITKRKISNFLDLKHKV